MTFREFLNESNEKQVKELEKALGSPVKGKRSSEYKFILSDGSYFYLDISQELDKRIGYYDKRNEFIGTYPNVKQALKYTYQSGTKSKPCQEVLYLLDKDFEYKDALEKVLKDYKVLDKATLEKELDLYI